MNHIASAPQYAQWLGNTNDVMGAFLAASATPGLINLGGGLPDPALFPAQDIAELAARIVRDYPNEAIGYGPIHGLPMLRALIAEQMSTNGLHIAPENVLITTGGTQALDLIGKAFIDPGDLVVVQHPTYLGALDAFRPRMPLLRTMDLKSDVDLNGVLKGAKFVYTVPNFSNPTGALVGKAQRLALLECAEQNGTYLVEDDPYGTLHYDSAPVPSALKLSATRDDQPYSGRCIYLGSLSKKISPGLRIGWVIAAPQVVASLGLAKQGGDMCTSGLTQMIAYEAMRTGLVEHILPAALSSYRARRDALCSALKDQASDLFDWEHPSGGMFVWARGKSTAFNADLVVQYGLEHGVLVSPSSVFDCTGKDTTALRLNFTLNNEADLRTAVKRLAAATRKQLSQNEPSKATSTFIS